MVDQLARKWWAELQSCEEDLERPWWLIASWRFFPAADGPRQPGENLTGKVIMKADATIPESGNARRKQRTRWNCDASDAVHTASAAT